MIRGYRASGKNVRLKPSTDKSQLLNCAASSILILRIAALAIAGSLGAAAPAHAEGFWSDDDYYRYYYEPRRMSPPPMRRIYPHSAKKQIKPTKEAVKPQGPLIIAISIKKQHLKIYDENGLFAETPVSTGMRGHTTPMGVFSIIQKQKFHESNIYSNAPMPFMQRITWSGIAMHAGVLPGYPASHGCIRMPMAFAVKMYGWTRMGARVVIAPDDMVPANFSHPLLVTQKPVPPETNVSEKADKAAPNPSTPSQAGPELKPTVGEEAHLTAAMAQAPSAAPPLPEQTHTAEATVLPAMKTDVAMTDAPSSAQSLSGGAAKFGISVDAKPATAARKDQGRPSDTEAPATPLSSTAAATRHKHYGPISIFISRKDSKLYVRQDFAPLFDAPVTIAPSDRPLGTHIFTAEADKNDANVLHWSVISLPQHNATRRVDEEHASRRRKAASAAETKPSPEPDSPAEALDRITIPADTLARITEALTNGSSMIVSDQGIAAGETGEGTEFIVSLR